MSTTADVKKRTAESKGGDPKRTRPWDDHGATVTTETEPLVLGLATEGNLRTHALEQWATFKPKKNPRTVELDNLMENGDGKKAFIPGPLINNAVELLKFVQTNTVGAIVAGHKMAGKSQTLQFVAHLLTSYNCGVLKFSMTETSEGPDQPPSTHEDFLRELTYHILMIPGLGLEDACKSLLRSVLKNCPTVEYEEAKMLQQAEAHYKKPAYGMLRSRATAESGQLAMEVLLYYDWIHKGHILTRDDVLKLTRDLFGLLRRDDFGKYLSRPCILIVDEVGEMLTGSLVGEERMTADTYLRPLVSMLSEQNVGGAGSRFYILIAGSRSVAAYAQKKHLQDFYFFLEGFSSANCLSLWELWKANLKDMDTKKLEQAEEWMLDIAPCAHSTNNLGDGVCMLTDGVAGCVTELFRNAIGREAKLEATLSAVVKRCFVDLVKELTLQGEPGAKLAIQCVENKEWVKFAEFGLTPSADTPPSAPVMSLLFGLLRSQLQNEADAYTSMLNTTMNLKLSGSFTGAVYQEHVLNSVLQGKAIWFREVVCEPDKTAGYQWKRGDQNKLVEGEPCTFYCYKKGSEGLSSAVHIGHGNLSFANDAAARQNPTLVVFFVESQTFPLIDLSICIKSEATATVDMYHSSVSIDTTHFAKSCTAKSAGHLPLKIDDDPPTLLRSARARNQIAAYFSTLMEHQWLADCNVVHHYSVFDDNATDTLNPTPPFKDSYMILSTKRDLAK